MRPPSTSRTFRQHAAPAVFALYTTASFITPGLALAQTPAPAQNGPSVENPNSTVGGSGPLADELTPEVRDRVKKGLAFLARNVAANGTVSGGGGDAVAIVALCGIAFLADGDMPNDGQYGQQVDRILDFILKNTQESGLITSGNYGSPMYGHGFATLFLAEVYGMSPRPEVKEKLQLAIRLIVQSQNSEGGWRYQPVPQDADISVTICQIMALRAARNAGIKVPKTTIDRAIDYVKKSQEPDGGFSYMLASRGSAYPRSAAGVACLYYAGIYDGNEIKRGIKYLMARLPGKAGAENDNYYYGNYYATQATFMSGGDAWAAFWPAIRADLSKKQQADGSWVGDNGPVYATAMALIMLQVPNRLLPILQK
ncbi:MAG TPA: prenyltransferase/squalene oxidase repeat-containing protein [Phycisphaerae bacterium]|nr:prenyltransferase/squalene oxidase repeat-containing protein [Phycisphaerae bacterium]